VSSASRARSQPIQEDVNQILLYVRLLLKIGLLEEHRGVYDSALAVYYQASRVVDHVLESDYGPFFISPHLEQLNVLVQAYICLAFLHAKRDPIDTTAESVMERGIEKISGIISLNHSAYNIGKTNLKTADKLIEHDSASAPAQNSRRTMGRFYPEPVLLSSSTKGLVLAKYLLKFAEMRMLRSNFSDALSSYIDSLRLLHNSSCDIKKRYIERDITDSLYENMGYAFSGLGDATSGELIYCLYRPQSSPADTRKLLSKTMRLLDEQGKLLEKYLNGHLGEMVLRGHFDEQVKELANNKVRKEEGILHKGFGYYVISAMSFILSGNAAEARLSLWKLSYVLTVGLSYINLALQNREKGIAFRWDPNYKMEWLFGGAGSKVEEAIDNPLQTLSMRAFGFSYQAHIKRLERLFSTSMKEQEERHKEKLRHSLCWSAAPLSQSATVMGRFWLVYYINHKSVIDENDFSVREMGPFPVSARILAYYFKARAYLKHAEKPSSVNGDIRTEIAQTSERSNSLVRGLRMLVHCAEATGYYEGGEDGITPPIGLVYYHIWKVLNELELKTIDKLKRESFFRKEIRQYLQKDFCRTRAIVTLRRMVHRHQSGEVFNNGSSRESVQGERVV